MRSRRLFFAIVALATTACDSPVSVTESGSDPVIEAAAAGKVIPPGFVLASAAPGLTQPLAEPAFTWRSPASFESELGSDLGLIDDGCHFLSFGFTFEFYGVGYSGVWVNSNGNMTFNACNTAWGHPDVPDGTNVLIAPLYGDLNPPAGGGIFANVEGAAPDRRVVVTWLDVPEFDAASNSTFQVQLFEGSNDIQFTYLQVGTDGFNWGFAPPSTDAAMDVGISSGTGAYINSASGGDIAALAGTSICYAVMDGDYTEKRSECAVPSQIIEVRVDVMPGSDLNPVNVKKGGMLPVAILTTGDFDAADADPTTITLRDGEGEGDGTPVAGRNGGVMASLEDVDGDGDLDLVLHFSTPDLVANGDLSKDTQTLVLRGQTFGGEPFQGSDAVMTREAR